MVAILLTQTQIRVGEAKNPGPQQGLGLTLGAINPTGLMRKASNFSQLPSEDQVIWGISETHLSPMGIRKFKNELHFADKSLSLHHGAPAPYRSQALTAVGGTHVGTAFVTSLPSRKLQMFCSPEQWNLARCTMSTFLCNGVWIHGAVVYGYSHKAYSTEVRQATDQLLELATSHVVQNLRGPRFIMGDFNQEANLLQQPQLWEKLGWKEVQTLQSERFGTQIEKTCKNATTKDFLWISPELIQFFHRAEVVQHVYPDHGALVAHFKGIGHDNHVHVWRQPKMLPWEECQGQLTNDGFAFPQLASPEESCLSIASALEDRVHVNLVQQSKPGLVPMQRGRCKTLSTKKLLNHARPLKASRAGEIVPEFQGNNLQHQRWFTQVRRLESLAKLYRAQPWSTSQFTHASREWRAILAATGFGNFRKWWTELPSKQPQAPQVLPNELPTEAALVAISLTVRMEVQTFEKILQADLLAKAKQNRKLNPNKVFKDFAKPAVSPVCILQDMVQGTITEIDQSDCSITLTAPAEFWPGEINTNNGPQVPIVTCRDKVWLESIVGLAPGQTVRQERFVGQLEEMFTRFQSEWQKRWDTHLHVPEEHWEPLTAFFQLAHPKGPDMQYCPITREQWYAALRKKKATAAQGPDGWTRKDLLNLPHDLTDAILTILCKVEQGQMAWPQQWLVGIVHSLEKYDQPASVTGYRPITIFSLVYRTWASIRSKEILRHLLPMTSSSSYGNLPSRSATDMWMTLQQEIESNLSAAQPTCGAVLDVVKCFNHLPRVPIFGVLRHMGVSAQVLRAWSSALCRMERRFSIRGSVSQAIRSTTGMAEGCSLSVVGTVACNQLIDTYIKQRSPMVRLLSYVDNLELAAKEPHALLQGTKALTDILELLDLQVDKKKTYLWSTEGTFRKVFLNHGYQIKTAARDVGAHMQYTRQATNFTITQKIEAFQDRWKSLALSPATYEQKIRAIKAVAWPNMLHGISSAHLGDKWYEDMRTSSMRALKEHRPGCSPPIHLSLIEHPSVDPGFHALWQTILQCRAYMCLEVCMPQFTRLAAALRKKPEVGPCSVVYHRLTKLHWFWDEGGFFRDAWGSPVCLWNSPIQELASRVVEAWRYKVACDASTRQTFAGLSECCAAFTIEGMTNQPRDRAVLRSALNGTFFTADHLKHRDTPGDTRCKMCHQQDSLFHRYWECEALHVCRRHLTDVQQQAIKEMPPATHLQGWFPLPTEVHGFRRMLDSLPSFEHCILSNDLVATCPSEPAHYFTDGSCHRPQDKVARICGWGVVLANPLDLWDFVPIAAGCLRGRHQTVVRAEITAAAAAVRDAVQKGHHFCLWSDNARVVALMQSMLANPDRTWSRKQPNHDCINSLAAEMRAGTHLCLGAFKVASHQQTCQTTVPTERWCFQGNEAADQVAAHAFQGQPALMQQWSNLCNHLDRLRDLRSRFHQMILEIGISCISKAKPSDLPKPQPSKASLQPLPMTDWRFPTDMPIEAQPYILPETPALVDWIASLHDDTKPVQRWSWWQLYLDAVLHIPQFGPWYHVSQKQWKAGSLQPPDPFLKKARSFSKYMHKLSRACKVRLPLLHATPSGSFIAFWTATIPVQVATERTFQIDETLGRFLPCASKTTDLRQVTL